MMTKEQALQLCDLGCYNEVIEAYMVLAMDAAELSNEDIVKAQMCLYGVFDETDAETALEAYKNLI